MKKEGQIELFRKQKVLWVLWVSERVFEQKLQAVLCQICQLFSNMHLELNYSKLLLLRIMSKRFGVFSSFCLLAAITFHMAINIALQISNKYR